jgi:hypothetical protein
MTSRSTLTPWYAKGWMVDGNNWWHTGLLDGTATLAMRTSNGYTWAILLNTDHNTTQFWQELKSLGWHWTDNARKWPTHDLFAPEQNATQLVASANDSTHAQISWANGNGSHRLLLLKAGSCTTAFPVDGDSYPAGAVLSDGTLVVANGTATASLLPALDPQRTYYARVVEYRQDSTTDQQPVYTLEGNATSVLQPKHLAEQAPQLALYPSPAHNELRVDGISGSLPYRVTNAQGRLLQQGVLMPERNIPIRNLPPGTYFLRVRRLGRESVFRFAKQ